MDTPSNGGRDSRYGLGNYEMPEMPILAGDNGSEIFNSGILHNRPTSITSGLCRSSVSLTNSCGPGGLQRGLKRTSSDMCYTDPNLSNRTNLLSGGGGSGGDCNSDIMEDKYSPNHQKNSPLSNGKKTKGRVKIKMEYIDNKLRRYTTFSKRKTGIMKKAYELSTLTGTQVMLLVASETGHVYTFATRKLQPMITSDAGKALIQTCLNSPDPCPSGSGDQRMSATGFEETELSYNIGDDEKVDSSSCSPYRSDSSDTSDVDSISGSPTSSSPPPLISLQEFQSCSNAIRPSDGRPGCASTGATTSQGITKKNQSPSIATVLAESKEELLDNEESACSGITIGSSCGAVGFAVASTSSDVSTGNISTNAHISNLVCNGSNNSSGIIFSLEQLQRDFGIHTSASGSVIPQYITIPLLGGGMAATSTVSANTNPPAAHQTPADLSNRSRK